MPWPQSKNTLSQNINFSHVLVFSTIITSIVRLLAKLERLEILVQIENLDSKDKVIIVAEIGNNHEGSFSLAKKLIDEAAQAGVDAVKFQTFQTLSLIHI